MLTEIEGKTLDNWKKIRKSDFIEKIKVHQIDELEDELLKLVKAFIKENKGKIDEIEIEKLVADFINGMEITKIEELTKNLIKWLTKGHDELKTKIKELENDPDKLKILVKEFIKDIELAEIEKELRNDFTERITKIEKLKKDYDKWEKNIGVLKEELTKQIERLWNWQ